MSIMEYARNKNFSIIGALRYLPEWSKKGVYWFSDEAGNQYKGGKDLLIITIEGKLI